MNTFLQFVEVYAQVLEGRGVVRKKIKSPIILQNHFLFVAHKENAMLSRAIFPICNFFSGVPVADFLRFCEETGVRAKDFDGTKWSFGGTRGRKVPSTGHQ